MSKQEIGIFEKIIYALGGAVLMFLITLFSSASTDENGKLILNYIASSIAASSGLVSGYLFTILQDSENTLNGYKDEYASKSIELSKIVKAQENLLDKISDLTDRVDLALEHYEIINKLIGADKKQRGLLKVLVNKAMKHIGYIPNRKPGYFYELLTEGIPLSYSWYGIHHGPISTLGKNPLDPSGFDYLTTLNNADKLDKKRLIILNEQHLKELEDTEVMKEFWKQNCNVRSFWITEKDFYAMQDIKINLRVDDCALYNGNIFYHYNRKKELVVLSFGDSNEDVFRAVNATHRSLSTFLETGESYIRFNEI